MVTCLGKRDSRRVPRVIVKLRFRTASSVKIKRENLGVPFIEKSILSKKIIKIRGNTISLFGND